MGSIEDVRERLSIEQVVGEVVTLKRAGSSYKGLCPFHNEKTPSFIVTPSRGNYKCFGCGAGGDIFSFVMATRHLEFGDALRELAAKAGVTLDEPQQSQEADTVKTRIFEMNAVAATYFQAMLSSNAGTKAREYLDHRTLTPDTIERFGLGYAPDSRDGLGARLRTSGYSNEDLVLAGLLFPADENGPARDRFRGRLMFPIRDAKGRILGFGGRLLDAGEPKYLNSPATPAFDKSRVLYTIEHAIEPIRNAREGVIVEGYVDALRAHQEGFPNIVATLGTAITDMQLQALARLAPRLVLALDADPAGQKAAIRAGLSALSALPKRSEPTTLGGARREPVRLFVATLPDGQDPDEAIAANTDAWRSAVAGAIPLMDFYFTLVESSLDRAQSDWRQEAIDTLVPVIGQLDGLGMQQTYIERLATLTSVDARYLRDVTPGGVPRSAPRRDARPRNIDPKPTPQPLDPARVKEEYLAGLLLMHRPLAADIRLELRSYVPLTMELAPLFNALINEESTESSFEELAERLITMAQQRPPLLKHHLLAEVRAVLTFIDRERAKRQVSDLSAISSGVDIDTARDLDKRTAEEITALHQLTQRLNKEQEQRWRQPLGTTEESH